MRMSKAITQTRSFTSPYGRRKVRIGYADSVPYHFACPAKLGENLQVKVDRNLARADR